MNILDDMDMGVSKLSSKVFLKVNYSFKVKSMGCSSTHVNVLALDVFNL